MATASTVLAPPGTRVRVAANWAPLAGVVLIQAVLLFSNIGLLTMWTDEAFTVDTAFRPVVEILKIVRNDIHPPLYFLLAHAWIQLPLAAEVLDRIRLLSAVWTLAATILLDRLWLARSRPLVRHLALGFWCFSPAVLLYGRMARSYSMQAALAIVAISLTWKLMNEPSAGRVIASALSLAALFYTHYAPALAITAAFGCVMAIRAARSQHGLTTVAVWAASIALAYAPWALQFRDAVWRWTAGQASGNYSLTGNVAIEHALKSAYWAVSFTIGESFPLWALGAAGAVALAIYVAAVRVPRETRTIAAAIGAAALFGYLGVAHWASYPFIPARMFWLLPFFAIAFSFGVASLRSKSGAAIVAIVLAANGASIASYYSRANFLNKGYAVPLREMATTVTAGSERLVLIDGYNTDYPVLDRYLSNGVPRIVLNGPQEVEHAAALLKTGSVRHVWIIANGHDISPDRSTSRIRSLACDGAAEQRRGYLPFEGWERRAMKLIRVADPPAYFYEVVECSR